MHPDACPDIGPICQVRDEPPQLHDQRFTVAELRATVEHGLTDALGVEVQFPLRLNSTTVRFTALDGTPLVLDYENIHHRDETLFGLGDPWVMGRYAGRLGGVGLAARVGFTVPLGGTVENPFALGDRGLSHQHVQFGTGTVQPLLGLEASHTWGQWGARAWGQAQLSLVENRFGYRSGHRFAAGLAAEGPVVGALRFLVSADVANEQPERWDGLVQQDGNLGRTDVLAGAGLTYPLGRVRLGLNLRVPVYQYIIGHHGQLSYPGILQLTAGSTFGGADR
ncbi:hypothetical protein [Archangium sp.]|uniref:hypothetical protein n=1 Tax=Archangium sp. TaxID=1872627 RepID=UPI002D289641|nr:hypothetical protein [Archangium sp.]HYO53280.1 hypothetical protein [Archangium sp.]